ncbi:MAG: AmmeMemoRadiSam system radical SAM enzyme [Vampirovibrionia bacterium]
MSDKLNPHGESRLPLFYNKVDTDKVQCLICANECVLGNSAISRCQSRKNVDGDMKLATYAIASSVAVDPIEKKPLYHFYPGTKVFSLGGWGCNFFCIHCQNWQISQPKKCSTRGSYFIPPEEAVDIALKNKSQGICWTYNEPAIWYEYTLDSAKIAKENGLYTAYVTNGFLNEEPLRQIAPFLDAYRVDFKCYDDESYKKLCAIKNWQKVYQNTVIAKELGLHVEVVTNIVPGFNDSDKTLSSIAAFIKQNLGADTPWHISRFFPNNQLNDARPTPIETIEKAVDIARSEGLHFVYRGNCPGDSDTVCPQCATIAVQRDYAIKLNFTTDGRCTNCNYDLNIRC